MLKIRLTRMGAKKNPFYRIIVIDSKEARNGAPTDTIGWYDPAKLDAPVKIDEEKTLLLEMISIIYGTSREDHRGRPSWMDLSSYSSFSSWFSAFPGIASSYG